MELKKATIILNNRFFKKKFLYYSYANFHSHLPEELFFDDFCFDFKKACTQTYKQFGAAFDEIDQLDKSQDDEDDEEDKITELGIL